MMSVMTSLFSVHATKIKHIASLKYVFEKLMLKWLCKKIIHTIAKRKTMTSLVMSLVSLGILTHFITSKN